MWVGTALHVSPLTGHSSWGCVSNLTAKRLLKPFVFWALRVPCCKGFKPGVTELEAVSVMLQSICFSWCMKKTENGRRAGANKEVDATGNFLGDKKGGVQTRDSQCLLTKVSLPSPIQGALVITWIIQSDFGLESVPLDYHISSRTKSCAGDSDPEENVVLSEK
ncbi:uncharacterized protein LOC144246640 [Lonchura striata]